MGGWRSTALFVKHYWKWNSCEQAITTMHEAHRVNNMHCTSTQAHFHSNPPWVSSADTCMYGNLNICPTVGRADVKFPNYPAAAAQALVVVFRTHRSVSLRTYGSSIAKDIKDQDLLTSVNDREIESKNTVIWKHNQDPTKCILVILNSHHQHSKTWPEMSPLQTVAATALLLACVYLSAGNPIPENPTTCTEDTAAKDIKNITGTEAINAKTQVDTYFKDASGNKDLNVAATCSSQLYHINLPYAQNVSGCISMVNVSMNLNYLLYMYSHVLGFIYQNSTDEAQMGKLDYLQLIYYRFSNHMQWYLQAHNTSHGDTKCIDQEDIHERIKALQVDFPDMEIAEVILCHLRSIAWITMHTFGKENSQLRPYKFCRILPDLEQLCITGWR